MSDDLHKRQARQKRVDGMNGVESEEGEKAERMERCQNMGKGNSGMRVDVAGRDDDMMYIGKEGGSRKWSA